MNIRDVLSRCHALAKDDAALAMDIRELTSSLHDQISRFERIARLTEEVTSLKATLRSVEKENRDLREQIERVEREAELRAP